MMVTFTSTSSQLELATPQVEQLLAVIQGEMTRQELMAVLGLKDRKHFADAYLKPALVEGKIKMTQPDKPNSRLQKYRLAQAG
ncbi:MAG: Fic family protein [Propionivibrio sp.]